MKKPAKSSPESGERGERMVFGHCYQHESQWAAIASIAAKIGRMGETLRVWGDTLQVFGVRKVWLKVEREPVGPRQLFHHSDRGVHARPLSWPRSNALTGSTIIGCWKPSAMCRRPRPKDATIVGKLPSAPCPSVTHINEPAAVPGRFSFVEANRHADPTPAAATAAALAFESESFVNFSNDAKVRETYEFLSDGAFVETFDLVPPCKSCQTYSRSRFKRSSP